MSTAPLTADPTAEFQEGQTLAGCYVLRQRVPGRRVIWLADDEVLGKEVSLHFVPPAVLGDAEAIGVLRHEVKRTRQLIHPSILRVYDFVHEDEWAAVAMDTFTGETLAAHMVAKPGGCFEISEIRSGLNTICQTIDDAHRIQLVHGDVSPENIIVEEDGRVRVANFGLSICIKHALGDDAEVGEAAAHQSPQQLDGTAPTLADDVYAVGVLIYRLLVGELPFPTDRARGEFRSLGERRAQLGRSMAAIPADWEQIVAACLQHDPAARPKSMNAIVRGLSLDRTEPEAAEPVVGPRTPEVALAPTPGDPLEAVRLSEEQSSTERSAERSSPLAIPLDTLPLSTAPEISAPQEIFPPAETAADAPRKERAPDEVRSAPAERRKPGRPRLKPEGDTYVQRGKPRGVPKIAMALAALVVAVGLIAFFANRNDERASSNSAERGETAGTTSNPSPDPQRVTATPPPTPDLQGPGDVKLSLDSTKTAQAENAVPMANADPAGAPPSAKTDAPAAAQTPDKSARPSAAEAEARRKLAAAQKEVEAMEQRNQEATGAVTRLKAEVDSAAKNLVLAQKAASTVTATRKLREDDLRAAEQAQRQAELAATEKARVAGEARKSLENVDASLAALKTMVDANGKPFPPVKKAADEMTTLRKKRETEATAAGPAAEQAQTAAADKARRAEQARQAITDFDAQAKDQLAATARAESELSDLQTALGAKQQVAVQAAAAVVAATAQRDEHAAAVQQSDQTIADARAAAERMNAEKMAVEARAREAAEQRIAEARRAETQRVADVQKAAEMQKAAEAQKARDLLKSEEEAALAKLQREFAERRAKVDMALANVTGEATPAAPVQPVQPVTSPPKEVSPPPPTEPSAALQPSPQPAPAPVEVAKLETKPVAPLPEANAPAPGAGPAGPGFVNSLGMKFVPVGDVLMAMWLTRVKDFEAFAKATGLKSISWRDPGFKQGPDHPVVSVSWQEANLFCKWLTVRDRKDGLLAAAQEYRLPTDLEWSRAVGLPDEPGKTPEERDTVIQDIYPWGSKWPPPHGAGNYTGEETGSEVAIRGYNDGFAWTSPVGSFPPNQYGLFDMGGNVWQWCLDAWSNDSKAKVLRGASWYNGAISVSLLSSCRVKGMPDASTDNYGFRVVIATSSGEKSARR